MNTLVTLPRNQGGVFGARLRVYDLQNVKAVDASIFPLPLSTQVRLHPCFAPVWERC